ncbi:MAG: type II secretion system F family protein [Candidatus Thermoplasmatota archaeon]|nr:type II secretion system F family protein [Candidatus Thermoplasmatota archaeon]
MNTSLYSRFCSKIFGKFFSKIPNDKLVEKNIVLAQANISIGYETYASVSMMNTIIAGIASFFVLFYLYLINPSIFLLLATITLPILLSVFIFLGYFYLPKYLIKKRGRNIDLFLPYAVNFISSMAVAGVSPAEIFESLSAINVYGEIQKESKRIAKDISVMGTDSISAIKNAIEVSPSKKFRAFLQGIIGTIQSGSDLHNYLSQVAEKFMQEDLLERKKDLDLLAIIGEVFVISVIAFPIFLVIILTIMGFFGGSMELSLTILLFFSMIILPMVYAGFYYLVKSTSLEEITKLKSLDLKETKPVADEKGKLLQAIAFSAISIITLFVSIALLTYFNIISPSIYNVVDGIFIAVILMIGPIGVYKYFEIEKKKQIQERLPEFLTEVGDSLSTGMTIFDAIKAAERGHYGELKPEIKKMETKLSWNVSIKDVFTDFAAKMKSAIIHRIVITINRGVMMGGSTPKIFKAAAKEVSQVNQLESQRKKSMSIYTIVILLCFFVFLAIILILNRTIFTSFIDIQANQLQQFNNILQTGSVDTTRLKYSLYSFVFVQSIGAGLLAGFMMDGRLSSGVRYSCALGSISFFVFKFLF